MRFEKNWVLYFPKIRVLYGGPPKKYFFFKNFKCCSKERPSLRPRANFHELRANGLTLGSLCMGATRKRIFLEKPEMQLDTLRLLNMQSLVKKYVADFEKNWVSYFPKNKGFV